MALQMVVPGGTYFAREARESAYQEAQKRIIKLRFEALMLLTDEMNRVDALDVDIDMFVGEDGEFMRKVHWRTLSESEYGDFLLREQKVRKPRVHIVRANRTETRLVPLRDGSALALRLRACGLSDEKIRDLPVIASSYGTRPREIERWMRTEKLTLDDLEFLLVKRLELEVELGCNVPVSTLAHIYNDQCGTCRGIFEEICEYIAEGAQSHNWRFPIDRVYHLIEDRFGGGGAEFVHFFREQQLPWWNIRQDDLSFVEEEAESGRG